MTMSHPAQRTAFSLLAAMGLVVFNVTATPGAPSFSLSTPTVTLADHCDLHLPIATVHVRANNTGSVALPQQIVYVRDSKIRLLAGSADLPQIPAHGSGSLDVPVRFDRDSSQNGSSAEDPSNLAGAHTLDVYVSDRNALPSPLPSPDAQAPATFPTGFCSTSTAPQPAGASSAFHATTTLRATVALPAIPKSTVPENALVLPAAVRIGIPQNLRTANNAGDCEAHIPGTGSSAVCQPMMSSGNLVLVWDPSVSQNVDGYRVYALVGIERGPVVSTVSGRLRTLASLPPITSGPTPQCYVVTATYGPSESFAGPAFCGREAVSTQMLRTIYARPAVAVGGQGNGVFSTPSSPGLPYLTPTVGHAYVEVKHLLGDEAANDIRRYAVAFELDPFKTKRLISATLHLTIVSSVGQGNNHSCATTVSSGVEFW